MVVVLLLDGRVGLAMARLQLLATGACLGPVWVWVWIWSGLVCSCPCLVFVRPWPVGCGGAHIRASGKRHSLDMEGKKGRYERSISQVFTRLRPDAVQSGVARPEFRLCSTAASQRKRRRSRWRCAKTTAYPIVQTLIAPTNRLGFPSSSRRCALPTQAGRDKQRGPCPALQWEQPATTAGHFAPQGDTRDTAGTPQGLPRHSRSVPLTVGRRGSPPAADGPHAPLRFPLT